MKTKEEIIKFLNRYYNPDKTSITIELPEIWDFFGITEEHLIKDARRIPSERRNDGTDN